MASPSGSDEAEASSATGSPARGSVTGAMRATGNRFGVDRRFMARSTVRVCPALTTTRCDAGAWFTAPTVLSKVRCAVTCQSDGWGAPLGGAPVMRYRPCASVVADPPKSVPTNTPASGSPVDASVTRPVTTPGSAGTGP